MKSHESIVEMFTRFTDVVNDLEGLGKRVSEEDNVYKILRCLPPKWNSKMETIEEVKNFKELPLEELISPLITYEMKLQCKKRKCKRKKVPTCASWLLRIKMR